MRANEFVKEARRNNFGREISNVQGQALGKKLASGDPRAQQALAQAKAAQQTNVGDMYGKNMDTLGITKPQERLAANKAAAAKYGNMSIDPDEVRTPQQPTSNRPPLNNPQGVQPANANPAAEKPAGPSVGDRLSAAKTKASAAGSGMMQSLDRFKQSDVGQKLGGWSQRLVGVGNKTAAGKQIWMGRFLSMVNNLIASERNAGTPMDFGQEIEKYLKKQNIHVPPDQMNNVKQLALTTQKAGYTRPDVLKLANSVWSIGMNASAGATTATATDDATADQNANAAGNKAMANMADQLTKQPSDAQGANAMSQMASQLSNNPSTTTQPTQPAQADAGSTYGQGTQPAVPTTPTSPQPTVPTGTKFLTTLKSGKQVKAEKTDRGWMVGGALVTDPNRTQQLDYQSQNTTKVAPNQSIADRSMQAKRKQARVARPKAPVRKLKAPTALAKGAPGKPAVQGKSRIRK